MSIRTQEAPSGQPLVKTSLNASSENFQHVRIDTGLPGFESQVSPGNPLPIAGAVTAGGTFPVSGTVGISGTVPVSGAVTVSGSVNNTPPANQTVNISQLLGSPPSSANAFPSNVVNANWNLYLSTIYSCFGDNPSFFSNGGVQLGAYDLNLGQYAGVYQVNGGILCSLSDAAGGSAYVGTGNITTGSNLLGVRSVEQGTRFAARSLDLKATAGTLVSNTGATLKSINVFNNTAGVLWLKLYNKATAPTAADTPLQTFGLAPGQPFSPNLGGGGHNFSTGIGVRCTTGVADADNVDPAANGCVGWISFLN